MEPWRDQAVLGAVQLIRPAIYSDPRPLSFWILSIGGGPQRALLQCDLSLVASQEWNRQPALHLQIWQALRDAAEVPIGEVYPASAGGQRRGEASLGWAQEAGWHDQERREGATEFIEGTLQTIE